MNWPSHRAECTAAGAAAAPAANSDGSFGSDDGNDSEGRVAMLTASHATLAAQLKLAHSQLAHQSVELVAAAADTLRRLWTRFPLLRTALAHVLAVTALGVAARMGALAVRVAPAGGGGCGSGSGAATTFTVDVGEETVAARYAGLVLERIVGGGAAAHPLAAALEERLKGAILRRADGCVLVTLDVERVA